VVAGASSAGAYWTTSGSGSGSATTGTQTGIIFTTTTATPAATLYPGKTTDLVMKIVRGSSNFTVTAMAPDPDPSRHTLVTGAIGACDGSWVTLIGKGMNTPVAAGSGSVNATVTNVVTMSASAPSTCQGATFEIPVILTGVLS
jgi:hypothetical protein